MGLTKQEQAEFHRHWGTKTAVDAERAAAEARAQHAREEEVLNVDATVTDDDDNFLSDFVKGVKMVPGPVAAAVDAAENVVDATKDADNFETAFVAAASGVVQGAAEGTVSTAMDDAGEIVPGEQNVEDATNNLLNSNKVTKVVANVAADPVGAAVIAANTAVKETVGDNRLTHDIDRTIGTTSTLTEDVDVQTMIVNEAGGRATGTEKAREYAKDLGYERTYDVATGGLKADVRDASDDTSDDTTPQCSASGGRRLSAGPGDQCRSVPTQSQVPVRVQQQQQQRQPRQELRSARRGPMFGPVGLDYDATTFQDRDYGWERAKGVDGREADVRPPEAIGYIVYPVAHAHLYEGHVVSF